MEGSIRVEPSTPSHTKGIMSQLFRDTCFLGDPDRDWSIIWDRGDPTDGGSVGLIRNTDPAVEMILVSESGVVFPVKDYFIREQTQMESWHWRAFRCIAPAGAYQVVINGRAKGKITLVQKTSNIVMKLGAGERTNGLSLGLNTTVRGYNTTMTGNLMVNAGCTIVGLTIDGNVTGPFNNVVFDSCTFRRGQVGPMGGNEYGCLFRDCRFENATVGNCSSGCFLRCSFVGTSALANHNFVNERSVRLAVINATFQRTDRGLVLRSMGGPNSDNLYAGLQFNDINMTNNGGELICTEGSGDGFNRNLVFCVRQSGCTGSIMLFDAKASDNVFDNIRVPVDIVGKNEQNNNIIRDSEVPYVHINWNGESGAVNTSLQKTGSVGFVPSARGIASGEPKYYTNETFKAVMDDGAPVPSTRAWLCTVRDQAAGFLPFRGVRIE